MFVHEPAAGLPSGVATSVARSLEEFQSLMDVLFVPLDILPVKSHQFSARLETAAAGDVTFTQIAATAHQVRRTAAGIGRSGTGYYKVNLLLGGTGLAIQDGREALLHPGDIIVIDTSRPYSLLFECTFRNLVAMFEKDRLRLPAAATDGLTAIPLTRENGLSPVLLSFLTQFPRSLADLSQPVRSRLGNTSLSLVESLFAQLLGERGERDPYEDLMRRIKAFIDANLSDPDLSPTTVARANFVSIRRLHALFGEHGGTVAATIRAQRLARCQEDLCDPLLAHLTVSAIAERWGFTDVAHFSRLFKQRFGMSPRESRLCGPITASPRSPSADPATWIVGW